MNIHKLTKTSINKLSLSDANGALEQVLQALKSNDDDDVLQDLKKHQELIEKRIQTLNSKKSKVEVDVLAENEIAVMDVIETNAYAYLTMEQKYISVINTGISDRPNIEVETYSGQAMLDTLGLETNVDFSALRVNLLKQWMFKQKRHHKKKVMSVFEDDYSDLFYNVFTKLKKHFIQPNYTDQSYDKGFDALMHSLGGGKEENIEYLKKWLAYTYLYPERCTSTPSIEITGLPGGNGKGVLEGILKIMYGESSVVGATRHDMDKFNALLSYGLYGIIDEAHPEQISTNDLKAIIGSKSRRHESKGIDACVVDNNLVYLFFNNHLPGMIKLEGGGKRGSDRRWSIIITNVTLVDAMSKFFKKELSDNDDVDAFVDAYIKNILYNRDAIAKFLGSIIKQYNVDKMQSLPPLHGEDYHHRYDLQKDNTTEAFDFITKIAMKHGVLPTKLLLPLIKGYTENDGFKISSLKKRYEAYLNINGIHYSLQTTSTTFVNGQVTIYERKRVAGYAFGDNLSSSAPITKIVNWNDYTTEAYSNDPSNTLKRENFTDIADSNIDSGKLQSLLLKTKSR